MDIHYLIMVIKVGTQWFYKYTRMNNVETLTTMRLTTLRYETVTQCFHKCTQGTRVFGLACIMYT